MTQDVPLAAEFPTATRAQWLGLVRATLKERPYETLIARSYDGLPIEPLYPRAARAQPTGARAGPWQIAARVELGDPVVANAEARHELENGAAALALIFAGAAGDFGFALDTTRDAFARGLDGIAIETGTALDLDLGPDGIDAAAVVADWVRERDIRPQAAAIRFGLDPLGAMARAGLAPAPWPELARGLGAKIVELSRQGYRGPFAAADGRTIHNAGGSEAQEVAFCLACAVAYLRALEAHGIALDAARSMIFFRLAADADQFLTIAKFRALRRLWARVEQACGLRPRPAFIAAETAWRMMSRRDPHVNLLRATVAAFSAATGGADAITVLPFTTALGLPDRFARRLARNTSLLLAVESHLAKVTDPAAGSGAVEDLTDRLGSAAWALFQDIERCGGAAAALERGLIQERVAAVRSAHEAAVARRIEAIVGVSEFADLAETPVSVLAEIPPAAAPRLRTAPPDTGGLRFAPLLPLRFAEPFEALRDAAARAHARPTVFLANLGSAADFGAHADFARSLFEAGGIEAVAGDGAIAAGGRDLAGAFRASGATLACLCSTDKVNAREAGAAARALAQAGAAHIYLAGPPQDERALAVAGIGTSIFAGCDALSVLRAAHAMLGLGTEPSR